MTDKQWPDIPDIEGLTLEQIVRHDLYATASDEEVAYSARCTIERAQEERRIFEREKGSVLSEADRAFVESVAKKKTETVTTNDKPWLRIIHATDAEMCADQRRHEDGEPFEEDREW